MNQILQLNQLNMSGANNINDPSNNIMNTFFVKVLSAAKVNLLY
jgi:hypothetical protein